MKIALSEHDQQIWEEELCDFVPQRIFDAHIHLFDAAHVPADANVKWSDADLQTLSNWARALYPDRETHFLVLGSPLPGIDVAAHNAWAIKQVARDPQSRMNRLVTPNCTLEAIRQDVETHGFVGLKPYRLFAERGNIHECRISEFLPEEQIALADEMGLWITMHLSRFHGCADEQNLRDLEAYAVRFPHVKWILAHCARSFTYWPIRQGIARLKRIPNIWYDVSAVTDVRPLITLFTEEDTRRIFYGSDGVDSMYFRGAYIALGRAWQGLNVEKVPINFPHCDGRPILAIYEQLLSMKHAAEIANFSQRDIDAVFWRNASEAWGVAFDEPAGRPG